MCTAFRVRRARAKITREKAKRIARADIRDSASEPLRGENPAGDEPAEEKRAPASWESGEKGSNYKKWDGPTG